MMSEEIYMNMSILESDIEQLEKDNAALVKRWEDLGEWIKANQNVIGAGDVLERMGSK